MARHVYVHVPFCARRCAYCDFAIAVRDDTPVVDYLEALAAEMDIRFGPAAAQEVDTIYLGGGTPSRLGGSGIASALDLLRRRFQPRDDSEITIEANPEDVDLPTARAWKAAGVNRVSLGSQTFDDAALDWMHRGHGGEGVVRAVGALREAGFDNLSLDLIFALPTGLSRDLGSDVDRILALGPEHVSLYGLTVEQGTPLSKWVTVGITSEATEDGYEAEFLLAHERLVDAGYEHYEVSNYARPGRRARHNSSYWLGVPYLGLGPSAHGYDGTSRRWNARHYAQWRKTVLSADDPVAGSEMLTADERIAESVYLGLRTVDGLAVFAADLPLVLPWVDAGWATLSADRILRCTALGWLRLDALAASLTHHRSR